MKILLPIVPLHSGSRTRGIGVYTRELSLALTKYFPDDQIIGSSSSREAQTADLVHLPSFDPFFLTLPVLMRRPTVVTIHDLIPLRFPKHFPAGIRGRLKWMAERRRLRRAAAVITDSESSKADIVALSGYPVDKVTVIPLGPNDVQKVPPAQANQIAAKYALPSRYLLYVGDINWNKNVPGLIAAFTALKDPRVHLILVGKVFGSQPAIPEYRAIAEAIEKSGKADKIHLVGFVPSHHLSVFYSRATLYVQPSFYEGYGLPILEAMRFGCPVATSDRGSLPEVGGDAVAYFDPEKNMTNVIGELLSSAPRRAALSAAGLVRAKQFTWERTARETHAVYEKILASSHG